MKDMSWKKRIVSKINSNFQEYKGPIEIERIQSIAVIGGSEDIVSAEEVVDSLSKEFGVSKNSIKVMVYSDVKSVKNQVSFGPEDFSIFGKIKSSDLEEFTMEKVDLLINYQRLANVYGNRVNLLSRASFKAGFESSELKNLNFELKGGELSNEVFDKELVKYLNILNIC
jgi:hypothetical protein